MGPGDAFRVTVFFGFIVVVYAAAAGVLYSRIRRRIRGGPRTASRARRWFGHVVLGAAALGLACLAWGYFVEPYSLTVTRVRIASVKVPKGTRAIRIVHVTDFHCDATPRLEERLPDAIAEEKPDLIAFTGDAVNSAEGVPVFKRLMGRLARIAPTFCVDGNWEVWNVPGLDLYRDTGAERLDGRAARVSVAGLDVWIAGISPDAEDRAAGALAQIPRGALTLFLFHYPYPEVVPASE